MRTRTRRGFVVLVVLLMLAVVAAIAVSELDVVNSAAVVSVRAEEEVQARAMAETCLALLQTYTEDYIGTNPPGFLRADFDGLLDRNGTAFDTDDHVPSFATSAVLVPATLTPTTGAVAAGHRWGFIARGTASNPGGCLVRIEDNSDDAFTGASVPVGTTSAGEGTGRDVANRDRDRAVYLTAIGLYPVRGSAAAAYQSAHARVTLRRLFAVNNPPVFPPAIQACSDVDIQSTSDVTGVGGIIAGDDTTPGSITVAGSSCGCGQYLAGTVTPGTPPTACGDCAAGSSPSVATGAVPDCVGPPTPSATYYMDNKGFGSPASNVNNIGDDDSCKVYIDRWGRVFVWDATDPFANDPSGPLGGFAGVPNAPAHDCTNYAKDPVELPCIWDTTTADGDPESVTCDFANGNPKLRQTPCWKPIATLGDKAVEPIYQSDVWLGVDTSSAFPPGLPYKGGALNARHVEMSSNENDEDLMFVKNAPIPNIRDQTKRFATGSAATTMCGDPGGCQDCGSVSNNDWWTECSDANPVFGDPAKTCKDFHAHAHQNNRHVPWPTVFAWDIAPGFDIEFEYEGAATDPMNVTILTNGNVKFKNDVSFCCAECGSGGACQKPATNPGITGKFIPAASCVAGNAEVPVPSFVVPPPATPPPPPFVASGYGYAFKADGVCTLVGDSTVVGDVECGSLALPGDPCIVGNVVATSGSGSVGCNAAPCTSSANVGVCMNGNGNFIGDIYAQGSVCTTSNSSITGNIFTNANISLASNSNVVGQIFAIGDITLRSNSRVFFDGGGVVVSAGNQGLTSFMESTW